ncbi:MAG: hypothetical protein U5N86_05595 [Planctomycetota bacterium]|nr:hypothetical protein [Planctomycetota bacterium]
MTDQWGWTPVAHDDKAFGLFSDEGLFAVPVAGYDAFGPHNYHNYCKTWLVEYGDTDLTLRGSISGEEMFHRTLLESGYLYAFSDTELVSFDITNLDVPVLEDRIELARNVLDIHPVTGGFVRAVQRDFSCTTEFVSGTDPNGEAAYSADIENASFYSMYVNGSYTYLVVRSNAPNMPSLMQLRVLDHTDGFALKGTLDLSSVPAYHWFGNNAGMPMMEDRGSLVRLADDLLVMKAYSYNGPRPFDGDIEEGDVPFPDDPGNWPERPDEEDFPGGGDDGGFSPPDDGGPGFNGQGKADLEGYYNAKESLLFIDLAQPTDPNICSRISIPAGSGELFADDGILYVSYWKGHGVDPFGHSASKYFVVCVDATDRTDIVASEPVNTPGRLVAVDNSVLYTSEVVYNGTNAPVRLFNALQISQGKANLTDSVEIPMDLLNVLMGEDGRMAAGFVRPDRYYIMADAPMESVSTGAEYSAQVYPPVEPENGKLVILNTSNPADLSITGQYEVASAYAELLSVSSPYVFVRTGSMLALQFKLVSGELEVADHVLCGWGYYGNRMRFATENAYIPAGLFGVAIFDLTK